MNPPRDWLTGGWIPAHDPADDPPPAAPPAVPATAEPQPTQIYRQDAKIIVCPDCGAATIRQVAWKPSSTGRLVYWRCGQCGWRWSERYQKPPTRVYAIYV